MSISLKRYATFFVRYARPLRRQLALLLGLILLSIGLQLVNPQLIRFFIDTATAGATTASQTKALMGAALTFLLAALALQGVSVAATYVGENVGWRATNQLRSELAAHCLALDMTFHHQHKPGEMIERLDGDIMDIAILFAQFVVRVLGSILLLIGVILVLLFVDWRISLALGVYALFALVSFTVMRRRAVPFWEANRQAAADLFGYLEEQLSGTEDIRSSGAVPYALRNLFRFAKERLDREVKGGDMDIQFDATWFILYTLGQLVAFGSGYWLFQAGAVTVGTVYLIVYYTDRILQPLNEITQQFQNVQKAIAGIHRVESLFAERSTIHETGQQTLPAGPLSVRFDQVTFGYNETEPVVREVSFCLSPGQVLGLLGRTGSGKTTLTRLLFRLYEPASGCIYLGDGQPRALGEYQLDALRSGIGLVTQEVQHFRATVRDNLTLFNPTIDDVHIRQVIDELGLHEWFDRLPDGLDSELSGDA
nr:ABC transporter ATP-binding protein [Caldilineaceae bacterium]